MVASAFGISRRVSPGSPLLTMKRKKTNEKTDVGQGREGTEEGASDAPEGIRRTRAAADDTTAKHTREPTTPKRPTDSSLRRQRDLTPSVVHTCAHTLHVSPLTPSAGVK